ncbi:hypothetical protein E4L96_15775 [Massilia arenosa]|uniref:Carboxypeptidase regulatory-like domain-containing protein n=1 Tax=Zemynaea arenosa TaxID=2561931 RepID=A0A4Y9S5V0_9BURK|nr:hypothetical protein [Massilia arenosa]TFW16744.1 hypothetical protein E4L96_15775 [Massilia arenosa]
MKALSGQKHIVKLLATAGLAATLVACGGGSDTPTTNKITVSGTAATGLAISGATITMTCKGGSANGTTGPDGTYSLTVQNTQAGPCVITVLTTGGSLRSIAQGDGAHANVTPLTELLVSYIGVQTGVGAGASASAFVNSPNVATVMTNPTVLSASVGQVIASIKPFIGDLIVPADFLTGPLQAKTATSSANNAQDQILDALKLRGVITTAGTPAANVVAAATANAAQHVVTGGTGGQ